MKRLSFVLISTLVFTACKERGDTDRNGNLKLFSAIRNHSNHVHRDGKIYCNTWLNKRGHNKPIVSILDINQ
jgi:hypothetical protein